MVPRVKTLLRLEDLGGGGRWRVAQVRAVLLFRDEVDIVGQERTDSIDEDRDACAS